MTYPKIIGVGVVFLLTLATAAGAHAQAATDEFIFGVKVRLGGRYDNVRMCVASDPGTRGGVAADVSVFGEFSVGDDASLHVDLPVFRPIMFAAAFDMLQFEPTVTLKFRPAQGDDVAFVAGPTLGVSLHYGPDYESASEDPGRGPSFFAVGPIVGGYFGLDFVRPGETFNFELGFSPYVTPMWGISDPDDHRGVIVGGLLDGLFRFNP